MSSCAGWAPSTASDLDLHVNVRSPGLTPAQNTRDVMLDAERAEPTLAYLERFHYASLRHVVLALLWHTMLRMGAARAIDLRDYHPDEGCVEIRHRPETGTPLKNQATGERLVALSDDMCQLLDDWIAERRPDTVDEYGRNPLLATSQGRLSDELAGEQRGRPFVAAVALKSLGVVGHRPVRRLVLD